MKNRLLLILLMLGVGPLSWATSNCSISNVTSTQIASASTRIYDPGTVIVTLACTGDGSTVVPLTGSYPTALLNTYNLTGYFLYEVGQTPSGSSAPSANYTVTIKDADGFALDLALLTGNGSASNAQLTTITNGTTSYPVVRSSLTVSTANTGGGVTTLDLIFRASSSAAGIASIAQQGAAGANPWLASGTLTNNNASPAANNLGVLPCYVGTAPTYTAGNQILITCDTNGSAKVEPTPSANAVAPSESTLTSVTTSQNVKASAGTIYAISYQNGAASVCWVQCVDSSGAGTLGTSTIFNYPMAASSTGSFNIGDIPSAKSTTGLACGFSTAASGASACGTAGTLIVMYK